MFDKVNSLQLSSLPQSPLLGVQSLSQDLVPCRLGLPQLEPVQICEACPLGLDSHPLGPRGVGPGLINLIGDKFSPNNPGGGVEGELHSNWGQLQLLDGVCLTENTTGGSINKDTVLINDIDDGGDLALVGALASKDGHTANLHKLLERHRELLSCRSESSNKS